MCQYLVPFPLYRLLLYTMTSKQFDKHDIICHNHLITHAKGRLDGYYTRFNVQQKESFKKQLTIKTMLVVSTFFVWCK